MELQIKLPSLVRFAVRSLMVVMLLAIVALPLLADTITVKSDLTNTGASVGVNGYGDEIYTCPGCKYSVYVVDPRLLSGVTTGLTFAPVVAGNPAAIPPTGVPKGTPSPIQVQVPGGNDPWGNARSGFIETTFNLPVNFYDASLTGAAFVDDLGYVFLNGHLISGQIHVTSNSSFTDSLYFLPGVNTLVISDWNRYGGPSGVTYYANINYSVTPEPASMIMLATGLVGLAGAIRRKLA